MYLVEHRGGLHRLDLSRWRYLGRMSLQACQQVARPGGILGRQRTSLLNEVDGPVVFAFPTFEKLRQAGEELQRDIGELMDTEST